MHLTFLMNFHTQIRFAIENRTSDYDKEKLLERLAKIYSGVAVLKVCLPVFILVVNGFFPPW